MTKTNKLLPLLFALFSFVIFNSHTGGEDQVGPNGCADCHSGGSTDGSVTISPNSGCVGIYSNTPIQVCVNDGDAMAAGFNITANGGTMSPGPGSRTGWAGPSILTHNAPASLTNGQACWNFFWTAPTTAQTITFNVYGNAINGNGWFDGDAPYFTSTTWEVKVALPIESIDFEVLPTENHQVNLIWETQAETSDDYFLVERSHNGIDFETLVTMTGKGATDAGHTYEFIDLSPPVEQQLYYRIRHVDAEERVAFSSIQSIFVALSDIQALEIYPTILEEQESPNIIFTLKQAKEVEVFVVDNMGRKITTQKMNAQIGNNKFELNIPSLSSGLYYVLVGDAFGKTEANRFIVK